MKDKKSRSMGHGKNGSMHEKEMSHHEMMARDFRKRFIVSSVLTLPVLLLSPTIQKWLGLGAIDFFGRDIVLLTLASVIALWGAKPFYLGALKELKKRRLGMMVLVSIAVGSGYLYSVSTTFLIDAPDFYWEISTLAVFLLFGHWMEMRSVIGASGALSELVKLIPPKANRVLEDGSTEEVPTEELNVGDLVLVRPGEQVPVDGEIIEGKSSVNESMITGESKPISKKAGDKVIGGTLNEDGSLKVKITHTGKDTALSRIIELVRNAQASKPRTQRLADLAAHYLTITAVLVGGGTLIFWYFLFGADFVFALTLAITVIVIACPHALGLAIPMVTSVTTTLAARRGILIQDMEGLEKARNVGYVVFDKTGTLTKGTFGVVDIVGFGIGEDDVLRHASSLDMNSSHVIAKSIVKETKKRGLTIESAKDFQNLSGRGGEGFIEGKKIFVGNSTLMKEKDIDTSVAKGVDEELLGQGKTVIYLAMGGELVGLIALADVIKEESREAVKSLKELGVKAAMLTGDHELVAKHVAGELGIDVYFAEVLPEDKVKKIVELQKTGETVMMVGDGVNDAPALTQADVGAAIGAGTDVAIASSEIVLVKSDPRDIVRLIDLSRKTMKKMTQNLLWAVGYNVVAIPIAAGILVPWDIILRPEWAALAMAGSSIIVVTNALLLKKTG